MGWFEVDCPPGKGHVNRPGVQNGAAKQESERFGENVRCERASESFGLVSMMSGPENPAPAPTRKILIALNNGSEHGEQRP